MYPAGTANLLALNLNMPTEPRALADVALLGQQVRFDLGELTRTVGPDNQVVRGGFTIMAGAGYDASIMEAAQQFKATIGAAAYLMAAVANLAPTASQFELDLDGEHVSTDGIAVLLVNFGRIQFDLPVANGADPRDGLFQVAVLRTRNVAGLLPAIIAGLSGAQKMPGIDVYTAAHVVVSAEPETAHAVRRRSHRDVHAVRGEHPSRGNQPAAPVGLPLRGVTHRASGGSIRLRILRSASLCFCRFAS